MANLRIWFSPHGTEWNAETYEEALEKERDSLVEQVEAFQYAARELVDALAVGADGPITATEWKRIRAARGLLRDLLSNPASELGAPDAGNADVPNPAKSPKE